MTTANIHIGLLNWIGNTQYVVGQRVRNASNCYQCVVNGTSSTIGGPSGIGNNITDSTVLWKYLSTVDYSGATGDLVLGSAQAGLPSVFTQNVAWYIWNDKVITTSGPGIPFLTLTGHTIAPFSLLITAAPGEGIRDSLQHKKCPLAFANSNFGVAFIMPNGVGNVNYFEIADSNVIIDGLQFMDPLATSSSTILSIEGTNNLLQYCIIDGYGQGGGAYMIQTNTSANIDIRNCLIIDREASGSTGVAIKLGSINGAFINSGIIGINSPTGAFAINTGGGPVTANNSWFFGYGTGVIATNSTITFTAKNCGFETSGVPNFQIDGGNNLFNLNSVNQFINNNNNFLLKSNSVFINAGFVDTAEIPGQDDITRTERLSRWDIGPNEFSLNNSNPNVFRGFTS